MRLTERLFSGQYIKLNKLSSRIIEDQIGCSLAQYFGKITISEALLSETFPSVKLTPAETEMLELLQRERRQPERMERRLRCALCQSDRMERRLRCDLCQQERKERRLKCALCQQELRDYEERVQHYLLHTSGRPSYSDIRRL